MDKIIEIQTIKDKLLKDKEKEQPIISKIYDDFFGKGYWEKEYKLNIMIFAEKIVQEIKAEYDKKIDELIKECKESIEIWNKSFKVCANKLTKEILRIKLDERQLLIEKLQSLKE